VTDSEKETDSDKPLLTEQEAAVYSIGFHLNKAQQKWPYIFDLFKTAYPEKFRVRDETMAQYELFLYAIAFDLQVVHNLYPKEQASRIERWVLKSLGREKEWGEYSVCQVNMYSSQLRDLESTDADNPFTAVSMNLLHHWLGEDLRNFEAEIDGQKLGIYDTLFTCMAMGIPLLVVGFWKSTNSRFELVEGDFPLEDDDVTTA
jgi:hypothetical protein